MIDLGYGNYRSIMARAAANVPLSDTLAIRIGGLASSRDGFYRDATTGNHLNSDSTQAVKGQLLFEPSDTVSIRLIGDYSRGSGNCCYATSDYINGPTQPLVDALTRALGLRVPSRDLGDFQQTLNTEGRQTITDYGGTLLGEFRLGAGTLKSVTALRRFNLDQNDMDPDFSGADLFRYYETFKSRFFSQELTYSARIDAINADMVLGAFYSNENLDMTRVLPWGSEAQAYWDTLLAASSLPPGTAYAAPGIWSREAMAGTAKSYAGFAHFDFALGDQFNIIAGLRYSVEKKTGSFRNPFYRSQPNDVFRLLGLQPAAPYAEATTDRSLSGTLGIQYRPTRGVMLYATYNRGFKAGGVNIDANGAGTRLNNPAEVPGARPLSPIYEPETVNAYEVGAKVEYLNRRARTNIAFFYYDLSNVQVAQFIGLRFTVLNANSAKDYGVEVENLFQLTDGVTLGLDGTWLPHARFGNDPGIDPVLSGSRFRYAPKFQGNATLNLDQPVSATMNLTGRIQYQYSGRQLINTASRTERGSVGVLNANLGFRLPNSGLSFEIWGQNLTNEAYPTLTFNTPLQTGDENAYLAAPRTYGVRLRASF
jgi:outer membrane receptor protein involved in Fe transport